VNDSYDEVLARLRPAYDAMVAVRQRHPDLPWKQAERTAFLEHMHAAGARRLIEIGAGTGVHGRWFADQGVDVVSTDPSAGMVEACRALGLDTEHVDVLHLAPREPFDAAFAMNCLLHVPRADLPAAFGAVRNALRPDGLFYAGQWGGIDRAGIFEGDSYDPKRFFSYLTDDAFVQVATDAQFEVIDFHTLDVDVEPGVHYQALTVRRL
jgi:SAM-dependent methyltransferase